MISDTNSIAFSIYSNKGVYALLLGSGISKSSGIPTGWDIVLDLIRKIATLRKENCNGNEEQWFSSNYGEEPDYSNLLEKLGNTSYERLNILKSYFEFDKNEEGGELRKPSLAHRAIAQLVKKGYIKVIITTNFDRLLEHALMEENIHPTVIKHPSDIQGATPLVHTKITVIKINGDYLDNRFLNTKTELKKYNNEVSKYLKSIFDDYGLITCGWSGIWDEALINNLRKNSNFRYSSYWTVLNNPNDSLKELSNFRKGQIVIIESADNFFEEINEKIDALETLNDDPLSLDVALARLKIYISKEEYRIKLYDLLINETKSIEIIISEFQANNVSFLQILNVFELSLSRFLPLIIHATFWSMPIHYEYFLDILLKVSKPQVRGSDDEISNSKYLPTLFTLYAIGLTAIRKQDYKLLTQIFKLKIISDYENFFGRSYLIERVNSNLCINSIKAITKVENSPTSSYLKKKLEPYFNHLFSHEDDFRDCFYKFEYFLSLNYVDLKGSQYKPGDWAPLGDFFYRKNILYLSQEDPLKELIKESEIEKDGWRPIKGGMFNSSYQVFISTKEKLNGFYRQIYSQWNL